MQPIITITTDFGDQFAVSQLKAVIFSLGFTGQIIENHDVSSYSVLEGAYGIWQLTKFCPLNTVHVGIVDPGVGGERNGIVVRTKDFWFVGPDNGLIWKAAQQNKILRTWKIDENYFEPVSTTFHGRDIFVKTAVLLSKNKRPKNFGCTDIKNIKKLEFEDGQVLHIDSYGNVKIFGENTFGLQVVKTFSDVPPGQPLILNGSSHLLELAVNLGNAKDYFGLKLGQVIQRL